MRKTKKKALAREKCAERCLDRVGAISEKLSEVMADALEDSGQFRRCRGADGEETLVDFKALKEAASALCTIAESAKAAACDAGAQSDGAELVVRFADDGEIAR